MCRILGFFWLKFLHTVSPKPVKLLFSVISAVALCFVLASVILAHPLGNFTINHYARLEIAPTQVQLYVVYDFAEIPTFQEKQTIDGDGNGNITADERAKYLISLLGTLQSNLMLDIGGTRAALSLVPDSAELEFLPGQGGLEIMQIRARYTIPLELSTSPLDIRYRDDNYRERLGWREIVAKQDQGVNLTQSNVRETETSDELRQYPEDLLANPLNDREANLIVMRGAKVLSGAGNTPASGTNSFAIITLAVGFTVVALLLAAFLLLRRAPS